MRNEKLWCRHSAAYLKPLSQAFGLPAPLSGEPLLTLANFIKNPHFKPLLKGEGDRRKAVEWFKIVAVGDTLIPHSSLLIPNS